MKKLFLVLILLLSFSTVALGMVEYRTVEDSVTNDNSTAYTDDVDMRDFSQLYIWFHCNQADTSKTDSITITFQSKLEASGIWSNILAFAEAVENDTFTLFKYFHFDSLGETSYPIDNATRFAIAWTDTNTDEDADSQILYPMVDTIVSNWTDTPDSASDFMVINEATQDTTEYLAIKGAAADSVEVVGYDDRADVTGSGACGEAIIDSVVWWFAAEWVTDTVWLAWAVCISDTVNCTWGQSRAVGAVLPDSATYYQHQVLATCPTHGGAWTQADVDSIVTFWYPVTVNSGGAARLNHSYLVVHYDEGRLFPTFKYKVRYKFVE